MAQKATFGSTAQRKRKEQLAPRAENQITSYLADNENTENTLLNASALTGLRTSPHHANTDRPGGSQLVLLPHPSP